MGPGINNIVNHSPLCISNFCCPDQIQATIDMAIMSLSFFYQGRNSQHRDLYKFRNLVVLQISVFVPGIDLSTPVFAAAALVQGCSGDSVWYRCQATIPKLY